MRNRVGGWIQNAAQTAGGVLHRAFALLRLEWRASVVLGLVFSLLPGMLSAWMGWRAMAGVYAGWEQVLHAWMDGYQPQVDLQALLYQTMSGTAYAGLGRSLIGLAASLLLTPILQGALALTYHGRLEQGQWPMIAAVRQAASQWSRLAVVALASMAAGWMVSMLPSALGGLVSAVAGLLSFIPFVGYLITILSGLIMLLLNVAASFAVSVLLCYIWQVAICEGIGGFGALVKSFVFTRTDLRRTAYSLGALMLMRWGAYLALGLAWFLLFWQAGASLHVLMGMAVVVESIFLVLGALTAAVLYAQHPLRGGNGYDAPVRPQRMKSANLDNETRE
ncbi:MAG: hypothetical protein RR482_00570 [Clostridia bacterium]